MNKKTKILLVYPVISTSNTNTSTYSAPLGLASIATFCNQNLKDIEIKILDGSLMQHQEQIGFCRSYKPDIIGLSPTVSSQKNAYEIAELAKNNDALVLFGGVNSSNLFRNMLKNREFIDGVILFDGEIPFYQIVKKFIEGKKSKEDLFTETPNVAYKKKNGEICEPSKIYIPRLEDIPKIDYSVLDMKRFLEQTKKRGFGNAITYYAGKGCAKRSKGDVEREYSFDEYISLVKAMKTCGFCGRNELGFRTLSQDKEAEIVRELYDKYGITRFFNVQDTIKINYQRNKSLGLENCIFRLFVGIENINEKNISILKQRYGPNIILQAGIESADPNMRKAFGKVQIDKSKLIKIFDLMEKEKIKLHPSFIYGGKGETKESIETTISIIEEIARRPSLSDWILVSPEMLLPGSPDFRNMLEEFPEMKENYENKDIISLIQSNKDFLKCYTKLDRNIILTYLKITGELIKKLNPNATYDVKGIGLDEEEFVKPIWKHLDKFA
ncbi:MAG: hypothetical protein WC413_02480 [Candidatus Nanoarchaeia archaeon]